MTAAEAPTRVSIAAGPLVGPVLRRVVGMFAARADLPLDRLDDAVLVADLVAARAPAHVAGDDRRRARSRRAPARSTCASARCAPAAARRSWSTPRCRASGNVIEQLADALEVETEDGHEYLRVRLAYAGED